MHSTVGGQAPVVVGPYGPGALTYDAVRTVLHDPRFIMPRGLNLVAQGITSGSVWDRVCKLLICLEGAQRQRLRRLVSRALTLRCRVGQVRDS
jgi:cytochrome P450